MTLSFLTSRARGDHVFRLGVIKRTNLVLFAPPPPVLSRRSAAERISVNRELACAHIIPGELASTVTGEAQAPIKPFSAPRQAAPCPLNRRRRLVVYTPAGWETKIQDRSSAKYVIRKRI